LLLQVITLILLILLFIDFHRIRKGSWRPKKGSWRDMNTVLERDIILEVGRSERPLEEDW
jgi:hypothetical protein